MSRPNLYQKRHEWVKWKGGRCPVAGDAVVRLQLRNLPAGSNTVETTASRYQWNDRGLPGDITAYIVLSVPEEQSA